MFVHLRTHSCYSFLEGLPLPAELAYLASQQGMPALALTDHRWLSGAIEFYDDCLAVGVSPILGLELDIAPPPIPGAGIPQATTGPLVLLATSLEGWTSLCRLSSLANAAPPSSSFVPALSLEQLAANSTGLLCLTGGRRGYAARLARQSNHPALQAWLAQLIDLFPGDLYIELQIHTQEDTAWVGQLAILAQRLKLPAVATHDIHYLKQEHSDLQRVLSAIRLNARL
jgi:DNA polymerase-3 subunit alpha